MDGEHLLPKGQDALTSVALPDVEPARVIDVIQLSIRSDYRLLAEQCIREKDQFYLFVIQYKG